MNGINNPATTGTRVCMTLGATDCNAMAFMRCFWGTALATNDCRKGATIVQSEPNITIYTAMCQTSTIPVTTNVAKIRADVASANWDAISSRRLSIRSMKTPAMGPIARNGENRKAVIMPTSSGDSESVHTSQPIVIL